jgi:hypothetical protein
MKSIKKICCLSLIFIAFCSDKLHAQDKLNPINPYAKAIIEQGNKMAELFVKKDYQPYIKFCYPKLVVSLGGEQKMISTLKKLISKMESDGTSFLSLSLGEPLLPIAVGNEIQCVVPDTLIMKIPNGKIQALYAMIAISYDKGKRWYFIDTSGKNIEDMRKSYPNLSPKLFIPEKKIIKID